MGGFKMPGKIKKLFSLEGKTAVVTGGTGILGRHFCLGLAEFGARVAVVDLDEEQARSFSHKLTQDYGIECAGFACDVSDPKQVERLRERILEKFGRVQILHNNAASKTNDVNRFFASNNEPSLSAWKEVMSVNIDGMFLMARAFGDHMSKNGGGSIIQTASIYGLVAPDQRIYEGSDYLGTQINTPAVYAASKAGVIGLTKYLAALWGSKGVRVNTLIPGGVQSGQNSTFVEKYSARVPMGRMAMAEEMVGALVYLASDASSYVTGQELVVDGGLSCW
jgi:NAD(P)-dependent dehydrogenase (short-subunit alcohol dehydrogenase family)